MEIISEVIISNPDMRFVILDVHMTAGEEVSMLERYNYTIGDGGDGWSGFVHAQHFEGAGEFRNIERAPDGVQTNSVAGAHVAWAEDPARLRDFRPTFRATQPGKIRLILAYLKRSGRWLPDAWECSTCKVAVRALMNALFTLAGLPSPDLLDIFGLTLPEDWLERLMNQIERVLDEDHPVRRILTAILEHIDLRLVSPKYLSGIVCRELGFCTPDD